MRQIAAWLAAAAAVLGLSRLRRPRGKGTGASAGTCSPSHRVHSPRRPSNCSKASGGRYKIQINLLSTSSDQQRVSLVRRLAAKDSSIDILAMDVDWTAEFATAKWIRPWPAERRRRR